MKLHPHPDDQPITERATSLHLRRIFRASRKNAYCNADGLCNLPFAVIGNGYRDGEHRAALSGEFERPAASIEQGTTYPLF